MTDGLQPKRLASYLFIFLIALLFTLQFGPGSKGCDVRRETSAGAAATVNGKEIPASDFHRAYYTQLEAIRGQNAAITEDMAKQLGFPKQILDRMVEGELLSQAAKARGVIASDSEVRDTVVSSPIFQKEGRFDPAIYRQILHDYYRKTDAEYEDELRRQLSSEKLLELVQSGAIVSEDEVKARFQREGNGANLTFVRFLPAMYASKVPAPKPEALAAYAKAHEKEIADSYEANKATYSIPEPQAAAADGGQAPKAPPKIRPLEEVRLEVARGLYVKEKAAALAKAEAEAALAWAAANKPNAKKLETRYPPEKNNQPAALRFETETRPEAVSTGVFNAASDSVPHLGPAPALVSDIFALKEPKPLAKLYPAGDGFTLAVVTERTLPKDEEYAQRKATLIDDARQAKGAELKDAFIKDLKKQAKISTNEEMLASVGSRG